MEMNSNNPEKKKNALTDNCDRCGEDYELTPDTVDVLLSYTVDTHMGNLICTCPNCSHKTRMFIGKETTEQAVQNGIPLTMHKYAHPVVVNDFQQLRGMEAVETHELTNRHEALIHRMGEILVAVPDDHLYDCLVDTNYAKPHPLKWTD